MVRAGHRAVLLFLILRSDGADGFRAAWEVDPAYARGLDEAVEGGVEVLPLLARVGPEGIEVGEGVPFHLWRPEENRL
jgi:sugar fermentation stimulation protein A